MGQNCLTQCEQGERPAIGGTLCAKAERNLAGLGKASDKMRPAPVQHFPQAGFWTPRLGRTQPGTLRLIADDLPDLPSNGSAVSSRDDLRDA